MFKEIIVAYIQLGQGCNSVLLVRKLNDPNLTLNTMIQVQLDLLSKIKPVHLCSTDPDLLTFTEIP